MKRFAIPSFLLFSLLINSLAFAQNVTATGKTFWHFESGQVRPLAISPDGSTLFAVNTPDNHLEIFNITPSGLELIDSVPVGLEPVAVAARTDTEVWVVNHMSDSISIVDASTTPAKVVRTLLVGDEPRDIVFAGTPAQPGDPFPRAFITTAHRGQTYPDLPGGEKYGSFFTPSIGRADVWVFDADNLGTNLGGTAEEIITLFGDTPRALAATPNGDFVYAAIFHSGNKTTVSPSQGVVTIPNTGVAPSIPTIVQYDGSDWVDNAGDVDNQITLELPDYDVFKIDAAAATPAEVDNYTSVGTILFNMVVHPSSGKLYISNTEANNLVPNEADLKGNIHRSRISVIDGLGIVSARHLNKHINYNQFPSPAGVSDDSLSTPLGMQIASDGKVYVAAFSSSKIGVFQDSNLELDTFTPDSNNHITVSGGGPSGLVIDETNDRIYVLTRFDNGISIINRTTETEVDHFTLHNPEPASITDGRPFLYDANLSSTNGENSCASCHIFGRMDDLAWDLSDTSGSIINNPNPFVVGTNGTPTFHPMKGPMTTQSLRGMDNHGPMHWRGDRSGALNGSTFDDEEEAFRQFNPAFVGLLGRNTELSNADMQAFTDFILQMNYPPNPIRNLDNSLDTDEANGEDIYFNAQTDNVQTCNGCHTLDPASGFFGTSGQSSFEGAPQDMKVAHLRNMYQKVGMFGGVEQNISLGGIASGTIPSDGPADQPQVRGFGYSHSGSIDTLRSFSGASLFQYPGNRQTAIENISRFMLAFPAELSPIVGQQITLTASNGATVSNRIDLFIQRSQVAYPSPVSVQQKECDLIASGSIGGVIRNWFYNTATNEFDSDLSSETDLTDTQLRNLATGSNSITYTCAPPGSGYRMALDRDQDTLLNYDEISIHGSSPSAVDTDGDQLSDADEVNIHNTLPGQADSDGDNINDNDEIFVTLTDPMNPDSDGDGISDGDELNAGTNPNDAAPELNVTSPTDGSLFFNGDSVDFTASATDLEDGDLTANIQWSSSIDGNLGSGGSFSSVLSPGSHTITVSITDSQLAQTDEIITVVINGIKGDINNDGNINVQDMLLMNRHVSGTAIITDPLMIHRADTYPVNGDGDITLSDLYNLEQLIRTN